MLNHVASPHFILEYKFLLFCFINAKNAASEFAVCYGESGAFITKLTTSCATMERLDRQIDTVIYG